MADYEYVDVDAMTLLVKDAKCSHEELGPTISRVFEETFAANPEAEMTCYPMVVYLDWRPNECDIEVALPVQSNTSPGTGTSIRNMDACTALRATHVGPYEGLSDAWMEMWKYVEANGVDVGMPCWDNYLAGPGTEEDPAKWVTELYIPLIKH